MARTTRGLEWIAAAEIQGALGAVPTAVAHREVRFSMPSITRELLGLGTVDDVFAIVHEFEGIGRHRSDLSVLTRQSASGGIAMLLPQLQRVRPLPDRPSFDVTASFVGKRNFNRFEIADAVGTAVARGTGWSYAARTQDHAPPPSPVSMRVHLVGEHATLAVRVGEAPLHRRPYRQLSRRASLRPPVARALVLLAGLRSETVLLDPFCGAGTIAIEALLACADAHAIGFDIDSDVLSAARTNAQQAGVAPHFSSADTRSLPLDAGSTDVVATNPPWGVGVRARGNTVDLWREVGRVLRPGGRAALIAPPDLVGEVARTLDLTTVAATPVRLLGQEVLIALLAPHGSLFVPAQLFATDLERSFARYGSTPATGR